MINLPAKKLKYSCPYFESKGGHCKKYTFENAWMRTAVGCIYPDDISKCGWVQEYDKTK